MTRTLLFIFFFSFFYSWSQNIKISDQGLPNEPSIMIDPNNTNFLVAGANLNNVYYSWDSGLTWQEEILTSTFDVWGDPVIDVDNQGNFYFFHLSNRWGEKDWLDRIVCQKSTDQGETWNGGSSIGFEGSKQHDKQWSVIDQKTNQIYVVWTQFDKIFSDDPSDRTNILFSKSEDQGVSWSTPIQINVFDGDCADDGQSVMGAVPALGPNGEIYVTWIGPNGLMFQRSIDDGKTWLAEEKTLLSTPENGWSYDIPGIFRAYGMPVIKCDLSGGKHKGTIYVNWFDQSNGIDDTDVWLLKSTDGGDNWSEKIRVNDDGPDRHQFCTWMDIDQTNGNLHFVFYDRRNYNTNYTDVFTAYSIDGGENIINKKISQNPFNPNSSRFFGDYINISAHNNVVRPIWTRLDGLTSSIWTDISPFDATLSVESILADRSDIEFYPNPVSGPTCYISFKLRQSSVIDLELYDQMGRELHKLIDHKNYDFGKHVVQVDLSELGLQPGFYFYKLTIDGKIKSMKVLVGE